MHPDLCPDPGLAPLLAAASAPGRPHELDGQDAAVARFRAAYRPARRRRRRIAAIAVAAVAAASVAGTAAAAGRSWIEGGGGAPPAPPPAPSAPPSPARPRSTPSGSVPAAACRHWQVFRADPRTGPVTAEERRELGRLAGGPSGPVIDQYCARLLGDPVPTTHGRRPSK